MRIVDFHNHYYPPAYLDALRNGPSAVEVSVDADGNPLDTDGDGIPDYLEDSNGDGVYDAGDLSDWLVSAYNGLSRTNGLSVFTPLK